MKRPFHLSRRLEMKRKSALSIALFLSSSLSALAQQPSPSPQLNLPTTPQQPSAAPQRPVSVDEDVVRITTNLVQVDAVVTDKNGKPVTDLRPEEIQIFEDGRPQEITHFSYFIADASNPSQPAKPAVAAD